MRKFNRNNTNDTVVVSIPTSAQNVVVRDTKGTKRPKIYSCGNKDFIHAWQTSSSCEEVASKTETCVAYVQAKAARLRKKGIPLKSYNSGKGNFTDWKELIAYAKTFKNK